VKKLVFLLAFLLVGVASAAPVVVSTTQTSATVEGLECGSKYRFEIRKYAANGELSTSADSVEAQTKSCPDTQAPSVPDGLAMTSASATSISVGWNASTDNVGVAGYRLFRDGSAVGTTTQTSYTYTDLTCGTSYTLALEGFDAAGNASNRGEATTVRSTASCPVLAPSNATPPAISGTAQVGHPLSASQGSWTASPTGYAFQWLRCDSAGAGCSSISGATSSPYTPTSADAGRTMRVTVTASNSGGSTSATSGQTAVVAAAPASSCPAGQFKSDFFNNMTLSGTPVVSRCDAGVEFNWGAGSPGSGVTVDRFSSRLIGQLGFASSGTYTFSVTADDGVRLFVDGLLLIDKWLDQPATTYSASRVLSAGTHEVKLEYFENGGAAVLKLAIGAPVASTPPTNTSVPTISGAAQVGSTLSASGGSWTGSPTPTLSYQWSRCNAGVATCPSIVGANGATYILTASDEGTTVRVAVTGTNSVGSATATSVQTSVVQGATAPTPPTGGGTAHLWIKPSGSGSCTRSATAIDFATADARGWACVSVTAPDAAYDAANAVADASTILIRSGDYSAANIHLTGNRTSTNRITFDTETGDKVTFREMTFGGFLHDENKAVGPDYVTVRNVRLAEYGGSTKHAPLNRRRVLISFGATNITVERIHAGSLQTAGAKDVVIRNNEFGPCRAGQSFTGDPFTQTCGNFKLDGGWVGTNQERMVERILVENNYFHDFQFGPSCFLTSAGGTHTGSPSSPDCHYECVFLNGGAEITFRGNTFRDCALMDIFTEDTQRYGYTKVVIENNILGTPISYGSPGNYNTPSHTRGDALAIGCKTGHVGYTNLTIRNNSFSRNTGMDHNFSGCMTATNLLISGNVMTKPACRAGVSYRHNIYNGASGTCDATDRNIGGTAFTFYTKDTVTPVPGDFALTGGLAAPDDFVPGSLCPAIDSRGVARSTPCDAGAFDR
jgi:chitodextrinase